MLNQRKPYPVARANFRSFQGEKSPSTSDIVVVVVGGGHERKYSFHTIKGHKNLTKDESRAVAQILGPTQLGWAQPGSKMGPHISLAFLNICQNLHFSPFRMCSILFHACLELKLALLERLRMLLAFFLCLLIRDRGRGRVGCGRAGKGLRM